MSGKQMVFVFDQGKCVGCQACEINCKVCNNVAVGVKYRKVVSTAYTGTSIALRPHLSIACNHCGDPVCIRACPAKAYTKREEDGVVVHNPERCIGCQYCVRACPYNAPQFNEETQLAEKCDFCQDRLAEGIDPACVAGCPTHALFYGSLNEISSQYPQYKAIPNLMDSNPFLMVRTSDALHYSAKGSVEGGYGGEIDNFFSTDTGVHWWQNIMRPTGKAVLGAAAVIVGATAIKGAFSKGGDNDDGQ